MNLEIKKIITEVPLYCIVSFLMGAYTILLINFFYFDNDITPAGVSAFIASIALLFTIYAAFKVKQWLDSKVNEKAFTQTEKIIDNLAQLHLNIDRLNSKCRLLYDNENITNVNSVGITVEEIKKISSDAFDELIISLSLVRSLSFWNASVKKDIMPNLGSINQMYGIYSKNLVEIAKHYHNKNYHLIPTAAKKNLDLYIPLSKSLIDFFDSDYNDIFEHHKNKAPKKTLG